MIASQASGDRRGEERTIVCDQCGTRQDPEQAFCESCNAVLRWSPGTAASVPSGQVPHGQVAHAQESSGQAMHGQMPSGQAVQEQAATSAPGTGAASSAPGTWAAPAGDGREDDETLETPAAAAWAPGPGAAAAPPVPDPAGAVTGGTAGDWSGARPPEPDTDIDAERARALLIPVADPRTQQDRPPTVAPVLPGRPALARPEVRTLGEHDIQGGIACPWCGTPNPPDRHFCCRCAMSMAAGPANATRRPWWRRMLDYRNREVPWAGDRPRLRRRLGRILRWVAWAAVLALAATGLSHVGEGIDATRDHFAKRVPVVPDSYTASHSYPQHGPGLAFDEVSNTWWGPGVSGSGQGEWLEAHFQGPVTLLDVGITAGESTHADTLSKSALPHRIEARITMDSGKVTTKELILDQASGFQLRDFRFHNVTSVRFTLLTAYNIGPNEQVAIAEIEFFAPSQGGGS